MDKIPPFKLIPEPMNDEAVNLPKFKWAPEDVGTRHRLGGSPEWIEKQDTPQCSCGREMTFYAQLDSISDLFVLADCGIIYIFVCFDCFNVKAVLQSM
jgi:hypothetical protein